MPGTLDRSRRGTRARRIAAAALLLGLFAGATLATPPPAQAQCAMCRSAFDSPEGRRMIRKYQIGILYLLAVPFAAFGTVAFFAVRGKKKLEQRERGITSSPR
jgi:hypothetical protein